MALPVGVTIRADLRQIELTLSNIKNGVPRVATRAINRTLTTVRAEAARLVAADIGGIPVTGVRKAMVITKARWTDLRGVITITGRRLRLTELRATGPQPSRGKGSGVSYIGRGGQRVTIPDAFFVTFKSGHTGVFRRRFNQSLRKSVGAWSKNLPLTVTELEGPSIPFVTAQRRIMGALKTLGARTLSRNLAAEIRFLISRRAIPAGDE